MGEHRGVIGGALLGGAGACWITATGVVAGNQAGWGDGPVLGLLIAGGLCLAASIAVLTRPHREPKPERTAVSRYAEQFLKEDGLWPSSWQRLRHPRTPVGDLPIRVPASAQERYRERSDAIHEFRDELENNKRDLVIQLEQGRTYGVMHPAYKWDKYRGVLNTDEFAETRDLVQDAYLRTHALNQKTQLRYDAASHDDVNNPEWRKLSEGEVQERTEALGAVTKALAAMWSARTL